MAGKKKIKINSQEITITFSYAGKKSFMDIDKAPKALINLSMIDSGVLHIDGNSEGYFFLGKFLIAMGIREDSRIPADPGFHVHLRAEYRDLDLEGKKDEIHEILLTNKDDRK